MSRPFCSVYMFMPMCENASGGRGRPQMVFLRHISVCKVKSQLIGLELVTKKATLLASQGSQEHATPSNFLNLE